MAENKKIYRSRSKIDELPPKVKQKLDDMLADTRNTYQDIIEEIAEDGYQISRSGLHRYAVRIDAAAQRLRAAAEQTRTLIQQVRDNQDLEATEVASAILLDGLIHRIATAEEEFERLSIDKAGRLLVQLQRSGVYKNRWKAERRKTIESLRDEIMSQLKDTVQEDEELFERLKKIVENVAEKEAAKDE